MKTEFTKTRGHHCWWLRKDGKEISNFDENHEHVLDDILKMQEVNTAMYEMLEKVADMQKQWYGYGMETHIKLADMAKGMELLLAKARGEQHE